MRRSQRWRIIQPVADHQHLEALAFQTFNARDLVGWRDPGAPSRPRNAVRWDSSYTSATFPVHNKPQDLASFVPFPNGLYRCRRASSGSGRIQYLNNGEQLCAGANLDPNLSHGGHPSPRNRQLETDQPARPAEAPIT